ncbi:MAG: hypothetical protein AB7P76_03360 [Candidatus Melainabacteria bacterium]
MPFTEVESDIPKQSPRYWMFGRLTFDMNNMIVFVKHGDQSIEIDSQIQPSKEVSKVDQLLFDTFDFNPGNREKMIESIVRKINSISLGKDYKIYALPKKNSAYRRQFTY